MRNKPFSRMRKLSIINKQILPSLIYELNVILAQTQEDFCDNISQRRGTDFQMIGIRDRGKRLFKN